MLCIKQSTRLTHAEILFTSNFLQLKKYLNVLINKLFTVLNKGSKKKKKHLPNTEKVFTIEIYMIVIYFYVPPTILAT